MPDKPKVKIIKRYQNRKLYDTEESRYVTLEDIAQMIRDGKDVKVDLNLKEGKMSVKSKDGKDDVDIAMKDGKMSVKSKDGESNVSVDGNDGTFTTKTAEGTFTTTTGKNAKVPDSFPKDRPVYAGAEVTMASSATQNEMFNLQVATADALDKVAEYYKKELPAKGWKEENSISQSGASPMHMLTYTKEERTAMVMITTEEGKTIITLQTSKNM